jgi:integrative and conjugative element protein (TIGR02256 family)
VLLEKSVLARMTTVAADARFRHEVGGILLGSYRGRHLHIVDMTGPQAGDRGSRTRFHRTPKGHQAYARSLWRRSKGHVTHIGEWHSHPEPQPSPSLIDRASWVQTRQEQRRALAFVIIGNRGHGLWSVAELGAICALALIDEDDDGLLYAPRIPDRLPRPEI